MSFADHQLARLQRRLSRLEASAAGSAGGPTAQEQREMALLRGEIATLQMKARG